MTRLVLASTSPARLSLLRAGGIEPITISPGVDEEAVAERAESMGLISNSQDLVLILAKAKAEAVLGHPDAQNAIVIGCDSALEFGGKTLGKPHEPDVARARWKELRGNSGTLHSGHWLIDNRSSETMPPATGKTSSTVVHFANISDAEIDAYVATGEPLKVAGAFTVDSLGGAFISRIEGDTHTVIGLSLPTLRELSQVLGVEYTSFWNR
ncbi:MAG: Maf family protein [Micrococcales bacterium]